MRTDGQGGSLCVPAEHGDAWKKKVFFLNIVSRGSRGILLAANKVVGDAVKTDIYRSNSNK